MGASAKDRLLTCVPYKTYCVCFYKPGQMRKFETMSMTYCIRFSNNLTSVAVKEALKSLLCKKGDEKGVVISFVTLKLLAHV